MFISESSSMVIFLGAEGSDQTLALWVEFIGFFSPLVKTLFPLKLSSFSQIQALVTTSTSLSDFITLLNASVNFCPQI